MKAHIRNEKALTLVEILATLALLSIVFVGIMSVFSQMTLFNDKTYEKLDTMNLARQEMSALKSLELVNMSPESRPQLLNQGYFRDSAFTEKDENNGAIQLYKKTADGYAYHLYLYEVPALKGDAYINDLHQIHLQVMEDDLVKSESYGWMEAQ